MFKFISDIKTAVKLTSEIRQARKSGDTLRVERLKGLPFKRMGRGFLNTMESCTLYNGPRDVYEAVRDKLKFQIPDGTVAVMGHTRMTTQGNEKINRNNHPFRGKTRDGAFALAP